MLADVTRQDTKQVEETFKEIKGQLQVDIQQVLSL